MIHLPIKYILLPLAITVLFLLITGAFNTILGMVISGSIEIINLPDPNIHGSVPFETTLQKRRSVRLFKKAPLSLRSLLR